MRKSDPKQTISGHWRIIWMALWDQEYIDLVEPGCIKISSAGDGEFLFGVVSGGFHVNSDSTYFDSTWEGAQECDEARGTIDGSVDTEGKLSGTIAFWEGDESEFHAIRVNSRPLSKLI